MICIYHKYTCKIYFSLAIYAISWMEEMRYWGLEILINQVIFIIKLITKYIMWFEGKL